MDLQIALRRGSNIDAAKILEKRDEDNVSFSLPKIIDKQRMCEVSITFLNNQGVSNNGFCGKVDSLSSNNNRYFMKNISLKKLINDWYILEDDIVLISKNKKLIAIPIVENVYSLVEKDDYEKDYGGVYYSLYTRLYWKLKKRSTNISYQNFKGKLESEMIKQIADLFKK